jgi:outer membrane immunogenic protein
MGAALAVVALQPALAADLPSSKAPPVYTPPPPAFSWTGFYLDVGAGYGEWNGYSSTLNPTTGTCVVCTTETQGGHGFLGRGGGGFDYQFADRLVAGVFADGTYGGLTGTIQANGQSGTTNQDWSWAAGGRLGWLITPTLLAYGNAGFTQAHFTGAGLLTSATALPSGYGVPGLTANGWFAGLGVEAMFAPGWFWRTEYRYADYDAGTLADTGGGPALSSIRFHPIEQTITSGVVYKFGWPDFAPPGLPSFTQLTDGFAPISGATNWSGLYANAGIGFGLWSAIENTLSPATGACIVCTAQRQGGSGVFGTVGAGYDYQLTNKLVVGVLGDYDPSDIRGTIQDQGNGYVGTIAQTWAWAVGARLGWLAAPDVLTYTKAGFTQAHFGGAGLQSAGNGASTAFYTPGFTTNGWFLGGGLEAQFAPGWFWRFDYRYAEYDPRNLAELPTATTAIHFRPEEQTATLGLVYKFNWAAPVVAPVAAKY